MNKAQKYANSKNPQSTSEAKSLLRGYYKKKKTEKCIHGCPIGTDTWCGMCVAITSKYDK